MRNTIIHYSLILQGMGLGEAIECQNPLVPPPFTGGVRGGYKTPRSDISSALYGRGLGGGPQDAKNNTQKDPHNLCQIPQKKCNPGRKISQGIVV